jgi:ATP-binding cassette subfamily B protein
MSATTRRQKGKVAGEAGLIKVYRRYFAGEGRSLFAQAVSAFIVGISEAALLVMVAQLAFTISGKSSQIEGLGPINDLKLSTGTMFLVATALAMVRFTFQALGAHLLAALTARRTVDLRSEVYADYALASWNVQSEIDEAAVQDLLLRYVGRIVGAVAQVANTFSVGFSLIALLLSAIVIDPISAVLVVVIGGILFVGLRPLSVLAKKYATLQVAAGRKFVQTSLEAIGLSLEIRAFGVNRPVAKRLDEATRAELKPIYYGKLLGGLVTSVYQLAAVAIVLGGLYVVYEFIDRPLASLSAIVIILVRAMNQASTVQGTYHSTTETAPFAVLLEEQRQVFRDSIPASGTVVPPPRSAIEFEHVSYRYGKEGSEEEHNLALDDVSFRVEPGQAIGIIGPSGSGKSTLIQLILRLREPQVGRYVIGGVDTADLDEDAWFGQVAFVPQDCRVLSGTILDNIRFYREALTDEDCIEAAKAAHVHDEIEAMPEGYATLLGRRGTGLSGGQRQRVAIARALASKPDILVLDEPTSALDMRSEALVHETLTELQGRVTLLIIAHRLSTLKTCDRIMVFGEGKLQAFGSRAELETQNAFYRDAIALSKLRS